jgi:5-(carboxyamino)imidazole ribonucleotide synthase
MVKAVLPGEMIGILGGGQLGRMSAQAAQKLGFKVKIFDPSPAVCASVVAQETITAPWNDLVALKKFSQGCSRATLEFENIPPGTVDYVNKFTPCHPSAKALEICQNRQKEKEFLRENKIPCAPFRVVNTLDELKSAVKQIGYPCVLKTAVFGYDGKGQIKIKDEKQDIEEAWSITGGGRGVLESWISHDCEISVIVARGENGEVSAYEPTENIHKDHILHLSLSPARISPGVIKEAKTLALQIVEKLSLTGILAVEMFVYKDRVIVNELAPRPHNSGHVTLDNNQTSQFEQHIRAVCGLPLGPTQTHTPAVMLNILGDAWINGATPDWGKATQYPQVKLHLYGKGQAVPKRKMGHLTILGPTLDEALKLAQKIDKELLS